MPDAPPPTLLRLLLHALGLTAALVAVAVVIGHHGRYSADEGAVTITATSLADGNGWLTPHPLPKVDPAGKEYPLVSSDWGADGISAYAKHPAYPAILSVAERAVPGGAGTVAVGIAGTVAAALLAALLAREVAPGGEVATLWLVGVASPLLIDSQLLMAHALAAPAAALAVLAAVRLTRAVDASVVRLALLVATVGVGTAAATLLRTEGVFLGLGLAAGLGWQAARSRRWWDALGAAAAIGGAGAAVLADRMLRTAIVGPVATDPSIPVPIGSGGVLAQRAAGFARTVLRPGYRGGAPALALVLALVLVLVACWLAFGPRRDGERAAFLAITAGVLVVVRVLFLPSDGIPGLLPTFVLGWVGLLALALQRTRTPGRLVVWCSIGVFVGGVVLTQYAVGGGVEWGGRYFALGIPVVAPLAVDGLRRGLAGLEPAHGRALAAGLVLVAAGVGAIGVREQRVGQARVARIFERLPAASEELGDRPVVVTSFLGIPRITGRDFDDNRWLLVDPDRPDDLVARLRRAGIGRFVFLTRDPKGEREVVRGARPVSSREAEGWTYAVYDT